MNERRSRIHDRRSRKALFGLREKEIRKKVNFYCLVREKSLKKKKMKKKENEKKRENKV